jgi:hypothetical protein
MSKKNVEKIPLSRLCQKLNPGNLDSILQQLGGDFNAELEDVHQITDNGVVDQKTVDTLKAILVQHDRGKIQLDNDLIEEANLCIERQSNLPIFSRIPYKGVVRHQTTKVPFCIASDRYGIKQYRGALSFLDEFMGKHQAEAAYGALIDDGGRITVILKVPSEKVSLGTDAVELMYSISTTHDGTGSIVAMCTPRHTASDTIFTPLGDKGIIKIKHTVNVDNHMEKASRMMAKIHEHWSQYSKSFIRLANLTLTDDEARDYFYMVAPDGGGKGEAKNKRAENVRNDLFKTFKVGKCSKLNSCEGTLFGALIACLIHGDYHKTVRKSIKGRSEVDCAVESRISGDAAKFKADAFSAALTIDRKVRGIVQ